jgi:UDP-N-acetylmuramoyl-tripeptide--D-alanyl-D-alanine ligase
MIATDLATAAEWMRGRLDDGAARVAFRGVSTDSRRVAADNLFVALTGPNHDGHAFCAQAAAAGAAGVVVSREIDVPAPAIQVEDTRRALGAIGKAWRGRFAVPVIAVTGSNGKTTVKECIAAILRQRGPALATRGNLNNDIGVPLMLCELDAAHEAAVFELGANHHGEIDTLARMVRPDVGVITNAGPAHLEGFGSIEGVAHAKGELFAALPDGATAVIAADDAYADLWRRLAGTHRVITFAAVAEADVRVPLDSPETVLELCGERRPLRLPLPGPHNRRNAAAAAAAAHAAGFGIEEIVRGLESVSTVPGRLVERTGPAGSVVLDDTYNANPASFDAALAVLSERAGRRWAVVGEMAELGTGTAEAHQRLGARAREAGVERLWAIGPSAGETVAGFGAGAEIAADVDALAGGVAGLLGGDVTLLVKGSRSNRLERLVEALRTAQAGRVGEG